MAKPTPWFVRRPALLALEVQLLARDYPEFERVSDGETGLLRFVGELTIRSQNGSRRQKLLLAYPDDYDYSPPIVIPLVVDADGKEQTETLNFRHQMPRGDLCLFERDVMHAQVRGVDALRRAERWLHEHATGTLSPDLDTLGAELEEHYFGQGWMIAGPTVLDGATADRGKLLALALPIASGSQRYVLTHAVSDGRVLTDRELLEPLIKRWGGPEKEYWASGVDDLEQLAKDHPEHFWSGEFRTLGEEPPICHSTEKLVAFLYAGEPDPMEAFLKAHGTALRSNAGIIFALRYPARGGGFGWLFLRVKLREKDLERVAVEGFEAKGILLDFQSPREDVLARAQIGVLPLEDLRRPSLQLRNRGRVSDDVIDLQIVLAGTGALGSVVADLLAKSGVGKLDLFDTQSLRSGNVLRHVAGLSWLGVPKVFAVADSIAQHNPHCETLVSTGSILAATPEVLARAACVVSTIANDAPELALNERCVDAGATLYILSAQRGGTIGSLLRVRPYVDACFECLQRHLGEGYTHLHVPPTTGETVGHECGSPVLAASAPDLAAVAAIGARRILDDLATPGETNHWIWTTAGVDDVLGLERPMSEVRTALPPHPSCQTCAPRPIARIVLDDAARERMVRLARDKFPNETGGILLGTRKGDIVRITAVSDSGPDAEESPSGFLRDGAHSQRVLDGARDASQGAVVYVGEWHSHPKHEASPSVTDVEALTDIAQDAAFNTPWPVMLIVGLAEQDAAAVLHASAFPERQRGYAIDLA
jgi:integrative and conjugative element protein (TIGR02256 family)